MASNFRVVFAALFVFLTAASVILPGRISAFECGDVNQDGATVASDALQVLRKSVGLVDLTCATGLPATGQMTPYGAGSDGDVRAGSALSYTDNGDGTITDGSTGLMWEKKDDNPTPTIHDKDNEYTWTTFTDNMDGTITAVFLDTLNDVSGGGAGCFAGYCDWRIPNWKELYSIVSLEVMNPPIDPAFHRSETCIECPDVTLASCSCTALGNYWSSTTFASDPVHAWYVGFLFGNVFTTNKTDGQHVRAVRGGF